MIATVNQSLVNLVIPALSAEGVPITSGVTGTVRVFTVDEGVESDALSAIALVNVADHRWVYEWEPATLPAGQYHIEYLLVYGGVTYASIENLDVLVFSTPSNIASSQAAVQSDIASSQAAVQSDIASSQAAVQSDIGDAQAGIDTANAAIVDIQTDLTFVRQVSSGRWRIVDNQMVIYDTNGTTPILTFNLLDSNGDPASDNPMERVPVG